MAAPGHLKGRMESRVASRAPPLDPMATVLLVEVVRCWESAMRKKEALFGAQPHRSTDKSSQSGRIYTYSFMCALACPCHSTQTQLGGVTYRAAIHPSPHLPGTQTQNTTQHNINVYINKHIKAADGHLHLALPLPRDGRRINWPGGAAPFLLVPK